MRRDSLFPEHSVLLFDKRLAHGEHCFYILLPIFLLLVCSPSSCDRGRARQMRTGVQFSLHFSRLLKTFQVHLYLNVFLLKQAGGVLMSFLTCDTPIYLARRHTRSHTSSGLLLPKHGGIGQKSGSAFQRKRGQRADVAFTHRHRFSRTQTCSSASCLTTRHTQQRRRN
jgi:hypothetical protein